MIDKYEEIFKQYKDFIKENSNFDVLVEKNYNNSPAKLPFISCVLANNTDTNESSIDKIEYYESFYFTINIYSNDRKVENQMVSSQVILNQLIKLTSYFFGVKLNMKKTLSKPTPNMDKGILRQTMQFQCLIGNARGNIIRR